MRFPYALSRPGPPLWPLYGRTQRPRPIIDVALIGPLDTRLRSAHLDTGADDTVFPVSLAPIVGVNLTNAPTHIASGVGGTPTVLRYAAVRLRISDGQEFREWPARVGFTTAPLKRVLLGFAGCLQFFTAKFDGDREEVELTVNARYPGQ
jgi:hypothetical protein